MGECLRMQIENKCLFNFSASYTTGGYKRLYEYAKWFNRNGGAWFVIHPKCRDLITEFANNRFFVPAQSRLRRLYDDCAYLHAIGQEIGEPDLYYAYGIPMYFPFGKVNWFHLSNVLPLRARAIPLSLSERLKLGYLGWKIRRGLINAQIISAESQSSLDLIDTDDAKRLFVSLNGSDDELAYLQSEHVSITDNIATVVGTYRYKSLEDAFRVFEMLKTTNADLRLMIIGDAQLVPKTLRKRPDVILRGVLKRSEVIESLRRTKYYISTTLIENSFNAASEGVFLADESYISDIGPHMELLRNMQSETVLISGASKPLLHVIRRNLSGANLNDWDTVITEMIAKYRESMRTPQRLPD
jgi:glycosyltransferase involved in cell wall biosynthesis